MSTKRTTSWLSALAITASMAVMAGCGVETQVVGVVAESDINTPETLIILARGQNSELGDVFGATDYAWRNATSTDELHGGGVATSEERYQISDFHVRQLASWAQTTEAGWSGVYAAELIAREDENLGIDPDTDPLIARMWLNGGLGERQMAEEFCEGIFNYGPEGGILMDERGPYDPSNVVSNDSILRRVITYADHAEEIAEAGIAAGTPVVDGWYLFDNEVTLASTYGLKAQTYLLLEEWDLADDYAAMVPLEHEEYTHMNLQTEYNDVFYWNLFTDDVGVWGTPAHVQWSDDPRVPFVTCGAFVSDDSLAVLGVEKGTQTGSAFPEFGTPMFVDLSGVAQVDPLTGVTMTCNDYEQATQNEYRLEDNRYPRLPAVKYNNFDYDMEMVTGTEMKLIRAEVALRQGRLGDFTTYINELRAHYDLDPITEPAAEGDLEYPNAEDDAWSILDRERYLELWTEGRRQMDMRRWEHPFWTEGHYISVRHEEEAPPGPREYMCYPIPSSECARNDHVRQTEHCSVLPPLGGS